LSLSTTIAAFLSIACGGANSTESTRPKLAVIIVVDQMRADHLTRFAGVYEAGFARLIREGAVFREAHHDHSETVTGAGHATIATGCFPSHSGIVGNNWFERTENRSVYCAEDPTSPLLGVPDQDADDGRSPSRLLRSTVGDWLKASSPKSKVFGVARKDRAAILSTGKGADGAYWYSNGNMITSEYYTKTYPAWVDKFNESRMVDRYFEAGWSKLMHDDIYFLAREDSFPTEADGKKTTFPYPFETASDQPEPAYYGQLAGTPFVDQVTVEFAKAIVENENLGADAFPDILAIGCSAADAIGHEFGPLSQESMDHFLRLDRYLGELFDYLDSKVGKENYVTVLSSDHGVLPLPEELQRRGYDSRRVRGRDRTARLREVITAVSKDLGITKPIITASSGSGVILNYEAAEDAKVQPETLDAKMVERLKRVDIVEDVFTKRELASASANGREYLEIFSHSYHPERAGDLLIRFKPYYLFRGRHGTSHGSPYRYDTHVPVVFSGPGVKHGWYSEKVRTVDIAPTLAKLLGLEPAQEIDGRILNEIIER
jgi:predicted AlkP superfamily pyrophosphatase or phosphodiesterase